MLREQDGALARRVQAAACRPSFRAVLTACDFVSLLCLSASLCPPLPRPALIPPARAFRSSSVASARWSSRTWHARSPRDMWPSCSSSRRHRCSRCSRRPRRSTCSLSHRRSTCSLRARRSTCNRWRRPLRSSRSIRTANDEPATERPWDRPQFRRQLPSAPLLLANRSGRMQQFVTPVSLSLSRLSLSL